MRKLKLTNEEKQRRIDAARDKVASYFDEEDKRPVPSLSKEWTLLNWRLESIGSSLAKVSDSIGAPKIRQSWTLERIEAQVQTFIDLTGRHPNATRDPEFRKHDKWLRKRGTSLSWLCAKMGYESKIGGARKKVA